MGLAAMPVLLRVGLLSVVMVTPVGIQFWGQSKAG
jgi:hypothetical protein